MHNPRQLVLTWSKRGKMCFVRASLSISPCARLLMSSEVQAKWVNSETCIIARSVNTISDHDKHTPYKKSFTYTSWPFTDMRASLANLMEFECRLEKLQECCRTLAQIVNSRPEETNSTMHDLQKGKKPPVPLAMSSTETWSSLAFRSQCSSTSNNTWELREFSVIFPVTV